MYRPRRWAVSEDSPCPILGTRRTVGKHGLAAVSLCAHRVRELSVRLPDARQLAVVDPHAELVDEYLEEARRLGAPIGAVFETHVQADHVSGLPAFVEAGATAYLPAGASVDFEHVPLG